MWKKFLKQSLPTSYVNPGSIQSLFWLSSIEELWPVSNWMEEFLSLEWVKIWAELYSWIQWERYPITHESMERILTVVEIWKANVFVLTSHTHVLSSKTQASICRQLDAAFPFTHRDILIHVSMLYLSFKKLGKMIMYANSQHTPHRQLVSVCL